MLPVRIAGHPRKDPISRMVSRKIFAVIAASVLGATTLVAQSQHRGPTAASQHAGVVTPDSGDQSAATPATGQSSAGTPATRPALTPQMLQQLRQGVPGGGPRTPPNAELASDAVKERVEKLLKEMTLEDKVGQLAQYTAGQRTGPGTGLTSFEDMIANGQVGSLFNVVDRKEILRYQHIAMDKSRLKIPLLFGYDVIHGYKTSFPVPLALASSWNTDLVERTAHMAAQESAADGIRWAFSPMVDIARDARWGRIVESAGEDPFLGSAIAKAYVRGYQGKSLADPDSVAVSVKHFAAYGAAEAGRDYNTTDMSDYTLRSVYLPPYHAAIDAGAVTVMSAFNALNGVPSTANGLLLTRILRREWGFQGFVVSDYGAIAELKAHGIALDDATAAGKALSAGVDMDMESNLLRTEVPALIKDNRMPPTILDEAVRRILRVKFAMGLFDHPYADPGAPVYSATPEKRALAREAAQDSIILLKNANSVLPLRKDARIALIGPMADDASQMLGSWRAQSVPQDAVTLRAALEQRSAGRIAFAKGTDILAPSEAGFAAAVSAARGADVVLLCVGEDALTQTGEASSRTRLDLPGNQQQLLDAVAATGKPVVVVLFNGHPLALTSVAARAAGIVEAWYPGEEAGPALANLLYGDANFSAHATVSFPRSVGQEPLYYAQLPTGRPVPPGVDLTQPPANSDTKYLSRYIDEQNSALYPFGYGLSYSTFTYSQPTISVPSMTIGRLATRYGQPTDERLIISTDVTNTSKVAGVAVPQLYMRVTGAQLEQPVRLLRGYDRIQLAPGETKHIEFKLGFDELAIYGTRLQPTLEPSRYDFYVGGDSTATGHVEFKMEPEPRPVPPKPVTTPATPGAAPTAQPGTLQNPVPLVPQKPAANASPATK